jgi:hypothetical protein
VILALAGGASRAAFLSATVVGDILDITRRASSGYRDFGQQIFAISGVSGGSVGAAMVRAALEDAGPGASAPPCKSSDGLWFATSDTGSWNRFWGQSDPPLTWKGCLQSLTSGDFLSPAVLGLAFRDPWGGLIGLAKGKVPFVDAEDRAALLERALEVRYATVLAPKTPLWSRIAAMISHDASTAERRLERPFGRANGAFWTPILLLNATSVDTGRRVIASELEVLYGADKKRLFPEAYDIFEALSRTFKNDGSSAGRYHEGPAVAAPDISLSTAAILSARFPIISPYGGLRNEASEQVADRLVDGGYFENDGVTTAYELARALVDLDDSIHPVIVHITNDPVARYDFRDEKGQTINTERPPDPPKARNSGLFESLINPLTALLGTRGGHAAEAVRAVLLASKQMEYVRFQVFDRGPIIGPSPALCDLTARKDTRANDEIDTVSMSWWLSGAVQEYLDRQLCHGDNVASFSQLARSLAP